MKNLLSLIAIFFFTACAQPKQETSQTIDSNSDIMTWSKEQKEYYILVYKTEISLKNLQALRHPVPDWETYRRLVKVEDGYDNLRQVYLFTNESISNLDWYYHIFIDPRSKIYYHGLFRSTNMDNQEALLEGKRRQDKEVHGRERLVLLTNLSPSLHLYADALNKYKVYAVELKSVADEWLTIYQMVEHRRLYYPMAALYGKDAKRIFWQAATNRFMSAPISYYPVLDGAPYHGLVTTTYGWGQDFLADVTNNTHLPTIDKYTGIEVSYDFHNPNIYYGVKYDYFGNVSDFTNTPRPAATNYPFSDDALPIGYDPIPIPNSEWGFFREPLTGSLGL